jgi:hypothetical protein
MRTLRASEIGAYIYCARAWWYRQNGEESCNTAEMNSGTEFHWQHGRSLFYARLLQLAGWGLLLLAFVLLAVALTMNLLD